MFGFISKLFQRIIVRKIISKLLQFIIISIISNYFDNFNFHLLQLENDLKIISFQNYFNNFNNYLEKFL